MTDLLDAALKLAESGVAVFPCGADKSPRTPNGFKDASTDPEVIRAWAGKFDMIGAPVPDGQVIIDIDPRNGGDETMAAYKAAGLELPATKRIRTGGGGTHIYLTTDLPELNGKLGPGVDVKRAGKGYVIVPPSPGYKQFAFADPAPLPDWLAGVLAGKEREAGESLPPSYFEQFQKGTAYGLAVVQRQVGTVYLAREGERNDTLFAAACAIARYAAGGELEWEWAREELAQAALHIGLDPDETAATIENGWTTGSAEPRTAPGAQPEPLHKLTEAVPEEAFWNDWKAEAVKLPFMVWPILPEHAYVLVYGATEASKSMVVLGMTARLSHLGWRTSYYSLENPPHMDRERLRRIDPNPEHFRLTNAVLDLNDNAQLEAMKEREKEYGADIVVIDTYSHAFSSASEDGNAKAIAFARRIRWLMQEVGCSVIVIDHTGYSRDDEPRDASAKRQQVDVAILMRKVTQWQAGKPADFSMENKKVARFSNPFTCNGEIRDVPTDDDPKGGLEVVFLGTNVQGGLKWEEKP